MPVAGSIGAPFFGGKNVTEFLTRFEDLCSDHGVVSSQKVTWVVRYCSRSIGHYLRTIPAFVDSDWEELKASMMSEWAAEDDEQKMRTMPFLEALKSKPRKDDGDIKQYARQFKTTSTYLVNSGQLSKYQQALWFVQGLPDSAKKRLIYSEGMSPDDPETMDFERFYDAALEMYRISNVLSKFIDTQHHAEEASILVDRSQRRSTILDVPQVIQPTVTNQIVEQRPDLTDEIIKRLEAIVLPIVAALGNQGQNHATAAAPPAPDRSRMQGRRARGAERGRGGPTCYFCGKKGHIQRRCRVLHGVVANPYSPGRNEPHD